MFFIIVYFIFHWKYTAKENNIFQRNKFPQENIVKYYLLHYYEHMKERVIKGGLFEILKDESEVERIFEIVKSQAEY